MNFKRLVKNRKGISPIFATLILIAIAVIAGVVVYMFTSGTLATMTGGGTAAQEKVSIQATQVAYATGQTKFTGAVGDQLTVYAQSQTGSVTISNVIVKDAGGNVVGTVKLTANNVVGTTLSNVVIPIDTGITVATGTNPYTVTLVSSNGGNFVSPTFNIVK
jgi:flagellin-like protein